MKCTNNHKMMKEQKNRHICRTRQIRRFFCVCCISALFITAAGCGSSSAASLDTPYEVYQSAVNLGMTDRTSAAFETHSYFGKNLCVLANGTNIGTDSVHSEVAEAAGTFNLATGEVVYAQNIYQKLYPASTTKILTAYIVLKYCDDLSQTVTVSEHAVDQEEDSSVCNLAAGDVITVKDLLYGLLLRSGNDAAIALAEFISGSDEKFAVLMNKEALALGAAQSHFVNPNGLPDDDHYTSVYDLYLIAQAAFSNETFQEITHTATYDAVYTDAQGNTVERTWNNSNRYLTGDVETPEGFTVVGGKTGTTGEAGYCLVLYSKNAKDEPIISIVLKADCRINLYLLMNEMLSGFAN